ncbi:MAG: thermonuclease family protein [Nitrospinota bacterium]
MPRKLMRSNKPLVGLVILGFLFLLALPASQQSASRHKSAGKVEHVTDGDTVSIRPVDGGKPYRCRLYGIDAPETGKPDRPGQLYGGEATKALNKLIGGKTVEILLTGEDTYNREVCIIYLNGADINLKMIKLGYAWAYRKFLKSEHSRNYIAAETAAKRKKLGLWRQKNPMRPDKFKRLYWNN